MSHWHKTQLWLVYASEYCCVISSYSCAYTFDLRVCTNWTPNCKWPVGVCCDSICVFAPQGSTEKRDRTLSIKINSLLVSREKY